MTILSIVDLRRVSAENVDSTLLEPKRNVLRELTCLTEGLVNFRVSREHS